MLFRSFSNSELVARIQALLRRSGTVSEVDGYADNLLRVDFEQHAATLAGHPLQLTSCELRLLRVLLNEPGRLCRTSELLAAGWADLAHDDRERLKFAIYRLQKKCAAIAQRLPIEPVRGEGYRYVPQTETRHAS